MPGKQATHAAALLRPPETGTAACPVRLGKTKPAEQALAGLGQQGREHREVRIAAAALRAGATRPRPPLDELKGMCK
jgi:hypothetical protein